MSHFTTIKTKIVEKEYLQRALTDLGYTYEEGNVQVRGYQGNRTEVEVKITTNSPGYDIGLRKTGDSYEVVADWWGIKNMTSKKFLQPLNQRYAYHAAKAKLEAQGFSLVSEQQEQGEKIHLVLRRMV